MHPIAEPAQEAADPALVQAEINALRTQLAALDAELKRRDLKIQQLSGSERPTAAVWRVPSTTA
ncbi:MAG: hypothetical protein QM739_10455 [Propionivibrio sp.]